MPFRNAYRPSRWLDVASLAAGVLVPLVLFAASSWYAHDAAFRSLHQRADQTVLVLAEHSDKIVEGAEQALRRVADRLRDRTIDRLKESPETHEDLRRIVAQVDAVADVRVYDTDGALIVGSDALPVPAPQDRDLVALTLAAPAGVVHIGTPFVGPSSGRIQFALSMRAPAADGPDAVVVTSFTADGFMRFYDRILPDTDRVIGLTRDDGYVLVRYPDLGRQVVRLGPQTGLLRAVAEPGRRDAGTFTSVAQLGGVERYYAYRRISEHPIYVSVGIATAEAWADWRRSTLAFGTIAALGAALLILVASRMRAATRMQARAAAEITAAQARMFQAQKLEALGKLTSGVAHDFNNLLLAISGNLDLLRGRIAPADRRFADAIGLAVDRGEKLARQLLGFARSNPAPGRPVDLDAALAEARPLVEKLVGEDVRLDIRPRGQPLTVLVDAEELELSLMNLVANARDAMPGGGEIVVAVDRRPATREAVVEVRDTGVGMSEEVRQRCLEPFYTTKDVGRGTGLGLSAVYGFVQRAGGRLEIDSTVGRGTTVRIVLPMADADGPDAGPAAAPPTVAAVMLGNRRVLLVEDDPLVRMVTMEELVDAGFEVESRIDAKAALDWLEAEGGRCDVVVTDVGLPGGMSGIDLAEEIRRRHPDIRIIIATGYGPGAIDGRGLPADTVVLSKPFTMKDLVLRVAGA